VEITEEFLLDMQTRKSGLEIEREEFEDDDNKHIKSILSRLSLEHLGKIEKLAKNDKFECYSILISLRDILDGLMYEFKHSRLPHDGYKFYEFIDAVAMNITENGDHI